MHLLDPLIGHFWTIAPALQRMIWQRPAPSATPWSIDTVDEHGAPLTVRGLLRETAEADTLVVVLHGLGGDPTSTYAIDTAHAADTMGYSCLRMSLRGADTPGGGVYHAGLTHDLEAALAHHSLAHYDTIFVIGFSLGGHVTLRAAARPDLDRRVQALSAVCAPIELQEVSAHLDAPEQIFYREYMLRSLRQLYRDLVDVQIGSPAVEPDEIRTIRDFDEALVVPTFGFDSADQYYHSEAAARVLSTIERPLLYVGALYDPIVPAKSCLDALQDASDAVDTRWLRHAGHVYFPPRVDLGEPAPPRIYHQILTWLDRQARRS